MNNKKLNHNRIKELRLQYKKTQRDLAKYLNVSEQAIAYYEQGKREPKIETWEKLASFFKVPPSYLMGLTNDKTGWADWSRNTSYSISRLKDEVKRLEKTGRLKNIDDIQEKIYYAVESLDARAPTTTLGVIHEVNSNLMNLKYYVDDAFIDPSTKYLNEKNNNDIPFKRINPHPKVRKDMDGQAYKEILDILDNARYKLAQINIDKKYL